MPLAPSLRRLPFQLRHRLPQILTDGSASSAVRLSSAAAADATTVARTTRIRRRRPPPVGGASSVAHVRPTTGIEVARFGLLSVATLPFTIWIACFTYDYFYRVDICREALSRQDDELRADRSNVARGESDGTGTLLGREKELAEVSTLLDRDPSQIIVVAGGNEAGKSRFVKELLQSRRHLSSKRGVTYVQLAALVDSVSSFTQVLVNAFDLRWLRLRHALVDVLPFAGSEILVMKERFGDRDLAQALAVITDALKRNAAAAHANNPRPVIVIDGLGEGPAGWMRSKEGQTLARRFLLWCVYVTKERHLAHVVLTGNEQLVLSLTDQNRITRGHVKVVGLGDLGLEDAAHIVRTELDDATKDEIERITKIFGGFIHDVLHCSRDIQYRLVQENAKTDQKARRAIVDAVIKARFQQQVERVIAAFAQGKEREDSVHDRDRGGNADDENDMDPYLDPLKSIYSEAQADQLSASKADESDETGSWTQLQLWKTIQLLVESPEMAVSFSELRDNIYDGDKTPILDLMREDVLGFQVDRSSDGGWYWNVTPASPALGKAFNHLVGDSGLKERFEQIEKTDEQIEKRKEVEVERARLMRDRKDLDMRKKSLLRTVELGKELKKEDLARSRLSLVFESIVAEEQAHDEQDRALRRKLALLSGRDYEATERDVTGIEQDDIPKEDTSLQTLLKDAVLGIVSSEDAGSDKFSRFRKAFKVLDSTDDGTISASDLARVIKATTGKEVDMDAARSLVQKWDQNDDLSLDYNEFVRMLLAAQNDGKGRKKKGQHQ